MSEENLETQENKEVETTQDVVAREFDKLEAAEAAKETKQEDKKEESKDKPRDESGKFAKKEEVKQENNADVKQPGENQVQQEQAQQAEKPARNVYAAWNKEAQAELVKLPEHVQQMIQAREAQFHKGIQSYKEDAIFGRELKGAIDPYYGYLKEIGTTAAQALPALLNAEMALRKGTPEQKAQMFQQLAHDYGVDLQTLAQQPFNVAEYQLRQQLAALQAQVAGIGQSRQVAEEANLNQTIEDFAQGREFFEDVRETMADLLDRGLANNLEDAYTKALRLNDDVFSKWQAQQQASAEHQKLEQANNAAKAAKAASVSVKGAPTGSTKTPEPKTTEDAVRAAFAALGL